MNTDAITIEYGSGTLTAEDFVDDGFILEENLCSASQIAFGACEAAAVEVHIASTAASFVGKTLTVKLGRNALGNYKVVSDERASDGETRILKAYDALYDINGQDVADWYEGIDWNVVTTLKQFRESFFRYLGITQATATLVNDGMPVKKTMDAASCSGATILQAICEINGVFGHMNANGQFQYVSLSEGNAMSVNADEVLDTMTEDFPAPAFDGVLIRTEEGDIGGQYPASGSQNQYIITGNFLCYGKASAELQSIAQNALSKIGGRTYVPFEAELECQGNIALGGKVTIPTEPATFTSYVLQRKLVGFEDLEEYFAAQGSPEYVPDVNSPRNQMIATAQRINKLTTTLDATISKIENIESTAATKTELEQTAESISTTVSSVKVIAETASTTANTAKTTAESAETTASSAKATAEGAETTANTASATASAAKTTAESANTTAGQAKSTADTANSTANTAKSTADTAKSTAETAQSTAETAQSAADAAQASADANATALANAIVKYDDEIDSLQSQIDGSITTWFYEVAPTNSNAPAKDWTTTDLKNIHLGDLYYDIKTGYCYRWQVKNNTYSWARITDTDVTKALEDASKAQDTADSKRRIFVVQPTPPYDIGDLWVGGSSGDIKRCQTAKSSGSYAASDWVLASKYTDDTKANAAQTAANDAKTSADNAQKSADDAQKTADDAQKAVDDVEKRVTTTETKIEQLPSSVTISATETTTGGEPKKATVTVSVKDGKGTVTTSAADISFDGLVTFTNSAAQKAVDELNVGGRNYFKGYTYNQEIVLNNYQNVGSFTQFYALSVPMSNFVEKRMTFSFDIISPNGQTALAKIYNSNGNPRYLISEVIQSANQVSTSWLHVVATFMVTDRGTNYTESISNKIEIYCSQKMGVKVRNMKLEIGNKATDWSPAPEDISVENIYMAGTTKINGGLIETGSIKADAIEANSLVVGKNVTMGADAHISWDNVDNKNIVGALGYTPYNSSNPSGFQTSKQVSDTAASAANTAVNNLQIGGRNLLKGTNITLSGNGSKYFSFSEDFPVPGETYTISYDYELVNAVADTSSGYHRAGVETSYANTSGTTTYLGSWISLNSTAQNSKGRKTYTFTVANNVKTKSSSFGMYIQGAAGTVKIGNFKLEKGNKATDWSPAPEDMATDAEKWTTDIGKEWIKTSELEAQHLKITGGSVHIASSAASSDDIVLNYTNSAKKLISAQMRPESFAILNDETLMKTFLSDAGIILQKYTSGRTAFTDVGMLRQYANGSVAVYANNGKLALTGTSVGITRLTKTNNVDYTVSLVGNIDECVIADTLRYNPATNALTIDGDQVAIVDDIPYIPAPKTVAIGWSKVASKNQFTVNVAGGYTTIHVRWRKNTSSAWGFFSIPIVALTTTAVEHAFTDPDGYSCFNLSKSGNVVTFYLSRQSESCYIDNVYLV